MAFFVTGAVIAGGAGIASALIGSSAAKSAANDQATAAANALDFQKQVFNTNQSTFAPYIQAGNNATYTLGQLTGSGGQNTPNYSSFFTDPSFQFTQDQGNLAINRQAAATGTQLSGGTLKDIDTFNTGLASQQYGNYFNRLMGLSQLGAGAASSAAGNATTQGGQIGNTTQAIGQAQASGAVGSANAISSGLNSGVSNSLMATYLGSQAGQSGYGGNIFSSPSYGGGNAFTDPFGGSKGSPLPGLNANDYG